MPRTYLHDSVRRQPVQVTPAVESRTIPANAELHSVREAAAILTQQYKEGFTESSLRESLKRNTAVFGWHYTKVGKHYKLYLDAIRESVSRGEWR